MKRNFKVKKINDSVEDYHQHEYLGASDLKGLMDGRIVPTSSESTAFGTAVHFAIEYYLLGYEIEFSPKARGGEDIMDYDPGRKKALICLTPAETKKASDCFSIWKIWRLQNPDPIKKSEIEQSYYISPQAIADKDETRDIPHYLLSLHFLIKGIGKGIKMRPDALFKGRLHDWKTVRPSDYSVMGLKKTHLWGRNYFFSNIFYHYVSLFTSDPVLQAITVYIPKEKGVISPSSIEIDFQNKEIQEKIKEYLDSISVCDIKEALRIKDESALNKVIRIKITKEDL